MKPFVFSLLLAGLALFTTCKKEQLPIKTVESINIIPVDTITTLLESDKEQC